MDSTKNGRQAEELSRRPRDRMRVMSRYVLGTPVIFYGWVDHVIYEKKIVIKEVCSYFPEKWYIS